MIQSHRWCDMKRSIKCLVILVFAASVCRADDPEKAKKNDSPTGVKDSYEQVVRDMLKSLNALSKSLGAAIDAESAKKVKPELEKIMQAQQELAQRIDKLGVRSKEVEDELTMKFKAELEDALKG